MAAVGHDVEARTREAALDLVGLPDRVTSSISPAVISVGKLRGTRQPLGIAASSDAVEGDLTAAGDYALAGRRLDGAPEDRFDLVLECLAVRRTCSNRPASISICLALVKISSRTQTTMSLRQIVFALVGPRP